MGETIFIPYGAMYYLSKLLYKTAKVGFLTIREKNKRKKEIAKFVKEVLTIEELKKIQEKLLLEIKSNVKFKKGKITTEELEKTGKIISSVIKSKVCAPETPKFRILKEIQSLLNETLAFRTLKSLDEMGMDFKQLIKEHIDLMNKHILNIEGKGNEKSN